MSFWEMEGVVYNEHGIVSMLKINVLELLLP